MSEKTPPSRPALRKSVDATVHPALAGKPAATAIAGPSQEPAPAAAPPKSNGADAPRTSPLRKSRRSNTADAVRPSKKDPAVKLTVMVPKSLRKQLRKRAERLGVAPEALAGQFIADGLRDD